MAVLSARCRCCAAALAITVLPAAAMAAEWQVRPGESIAAAIAQASAGDTVLIARGRYRENLVLDKQLTLRGLDRPTISGGLHGDTIRITAADVALENLIITDSGADLTAQNAGIYIQPGADRVSVRRCDIASSLFGIWIESVAGVQIVDNLVTGKRELPSAQRGNGIQLFNSNGAQVIGNHISYVRDGIYVAFSNRAIFRKNRVHDARYGAHYMSSHDNVWEGNDSYRNRGGLALMESRNLLVRNNRAWANSDHGIMLRTLQDSIIENNVMAGNQRGLFVYNAQFNTLRRNLLVDNDVGVHLWAGSVDNEVAGNDFIGNREQVRYVASRDEVWGAGQGNYWSNYVGWDRDGDGHGDAPFEANDVVDRLVWRFPAVKLLLNSPALQTLRLVAQQFPLLRAPSIVDPHPQMQPAHTDWSEWLDTQHH